MDRRQFLQTCALTGLAVGADGLSGPSLQIAQAKGSETKLIFAATPANTSTYLWAATQMAAISKITNLDITVQETGGTQETMYKLQDHTADFAQIDSVLTRNTFGEKSNVRYVANGGPYVWQIFAAKDANIRSLKDLDGKPFSPGGSGAGSTKITIAILKALGIQPKYTEGGLTDALNSFVDRRIVGLSWRGNGTNATGGVLEAASSRAIAIIPWSDDEIATAHKLFPFLTKGNISAGLYPGEDAPVPSVVTWQVQTAVNKDVPVDVVYNFTKAYFQTIPEVAETQPAIGQVTIKNSASQLFIPLHPGALKFYREKGYKIPAAFIPPEAK